MCVIAQNLVILYISLDRQEQGNLCTLLVSLTNEQWQ